MKKITVDGPSLSTSRTSPSSLPRGASTRSRTQWRHIPYLKQYIVRCEDVEQAVKPARKTAPKAKKEAEDGKSDAAGA